MNIINFKNVTVGYNNKTVLNNINLTIKEGEHSVILGANGSGKSTLIKLMSNDIYPSRKTPYIKEVFGQERWNIWDLKKHLGIITNDIHNDFINQAKFTTGLDVILSGFHSTLGLFTYQEFTQYQMEKSLEIMSFLEIESLEYKKVGEMSTGELRKCIIGRALIHNPKAMLLDEPTVGLDIKAQINFIEIIRKISKTTTIILITHHIEEIFEEISKAILIADGTIYKQGDKKDIIISKNLSDIFDLNLDIDMKSGRYYIKNVYGY